MRTDVNACDHTWECMDTVRESALKVDSTRKIPCCIRESNLRQQRAVQCSTNWATSPPCKSCKVACDDIVSCPGMICLFGLLPTVCTCIFYCFFFFVWAHCAPALVRDDVPKKCHYYYYIRVNYKPIKPTSYSRLFVELVLSRVRRFWNLLRSPVRTAGHRAVMWSMSMTQSA